MNNRCASNEIRWSIDKERVGLDKVEYVLYEYHKEGVFALRSVKIERFRHHALQEVQAELNRRLVYPVTLTATYYTADGSTPGG